MIIANMATFPPRQHALEAAVRRIAPQVDRLNLCLNQFDEVPGFLSGISNIHAEIPDQDLKDLGKFMFDADPKDDVFLVDDDLEYPENYVARSLEVRERLARNSGHNCIFGYHGTIYIRPSLVRSLKDIAKRRGLRWSLLGRERKVYAYHRGQEDARFVAQLGTGAVLAKGSQLPPLSFMMGADRRADVRFARWALDRKMPLVSMPKEEAWIPRGGDDEFAIFKTYTSKLPDAFVREVLSFAFRVPNLDGHAGS